MQPDADDPDLTPQPELAPDFEPTSAAEPTADPESTPDAEPTLDPEPTPDAEPTPEPEPSRFRKVADWFNREDLARELLIGGLLAVGVAVALALYGDARDDARQQQAEVLENTRFVRQAAMDPAVVLKPFRGMSLSEAQLSGLPLGCPKGAEPRDTDAGCAALINADLGGADLFLADLSGADLGGADLGGADLSYADLGGADLYNADLSDAFLINADLSRADLSYADLFLADLSGADLGGADLSYADLTGAHLGGSLYREGANLTDVDLTLACYSATTQWPDGFEPDEGPNCEFRRR